MKDRSPDELQDVQSLVQSDPPAVMSFDDSSIFLQAILQGPSRAYWLARVNRCAASELIDRMRAWITPIRKAIEIERSALQSYRPASSEPVKVIDNDGCEWAIAWTAHEAAIEFVSGFLFDIEVWLGDTAGNHRLKRLFEHLKHNHERILAFLCTS